MAKPNYQGEKRRRDLEKLAKKKAKMERRLTKGKSPSSTDQNESTAPSNSSAG